MIVDLEHVVARQFDLESGEPCIQLIWPGDSEESPRAELIWGHENLRHLALFIAGVLKQEAGSEQGN